MKKWYVYQHIRLDKNEVFYIGIGMTPNFHRAFEKNKRNIIWKNIANKTEYKVEILYENLSEVDAKSKEKELIKDFGKIIDGGLLSNITDGGDGTSGFKHKDETKKIIKDKRKLQKFSEETIKKLCEVRLGNTNAKGKKHSEEKNQIKSEKQRGKFGGVIIRTDIDGNKIEFKSIKDAGDSIETSYKNIWYAATQRKGKLYKGFYWEYLNDIKQEKNNEIITKDYLYNEYIINKKSGEKISQELNCSVNKIYRLLKIYKFQ
jgi:hypothetical protein